MKSCKPLMIALSILAATAALAVPPGTEEEIRERLQPFGDVCRTGEPCAASAGASASGGGTRTGQQVFDQFCTACHSTGVAGAPKIGDKTAWGPRIDKGMDTLWQHTLHGFNAMPPKGTCMDCSDDELRAAMEHIVSQAQ